MQQVNDWYERAAAALDLREDDGDALAAPVTPPSLEALVISGASAELGDSQASDEPAAGPLPRKRRLPQPAEPADDAEPAAEPAAAAEAAPVEPAAAERS